MGAGDHAAFVERRASCLGDLEIPLLASFPYLLGDAERVLAGQWSARVGRGRSLRRSARVPASRRSRYDRQSRSIPGRLKRDHRRRKSLSVHGGVAWSSARSRVGVPRSVVARQDLATSRNPIRGHRQVGSLTGAVHLSKNNAGVLRPAQRGRKPRVEQKGKSWLDPGRSVRVGTAKASASRSSRPLKSFQREVSEKLPQG